jgi:N-acetylglucosamine kinase-like BadF-type ATPase
VTETLVGVDLGGTKTQVAAARDGELVLNETRPSMDWSRVPWSDAATWLAEMLDDLLPEWRVASCLVVGAHGCDSAAQIEQLRTPLLGMTSAACEVLNDAELVVPASGIAEGVGLIVGTGSIAAARTSSGKTVTAGGWGWILGDEGSAPALVRDSLRAVLARHEDGIAPDALGSALMRAFGVETPPDLLVAASESADKRGWGRHARHVFSAAHAGSQDAIGVIDAAAEGLCDVLQRVAHQGAALDNVVVAGGVAQNQPLLLAALRQQMSVRFPQATLCTLQSAPVRGALALAWQRVGWRGEAAHVPVGVLPEQALAYGLQ